MHIKEIPALADRAPEVGKRLWPLVIDGGRMGRSGAASTDGKVPVTKGRGTVDIIRGLLPSLVRAAALPFRLLDDLNRNRTFLHDLP